MRRNSSAIGESHGRGAVGHQPRKSHQRTLVEGVNVRDTQRAESHICPAWALPTSFSPPPLGQNHILMWEGVLAASRPGIASKPASDLDQEVSLSSFPFISHLRPRVSLPELPPPAELRGPISPCSALPGGRGMAPPLFPFAHRWPPQLYLGLLLRGLRDRGGPRHTGPRGALAEPEGPGLAKGRLMLDAAWRAGFWGSQGLAADATPWPTQG